MEEDYDFKFILMDVDKTAFRKILALETLKRNPKLALKLLLKRPTFYIYGALYKLLGTDGLRKRFFEELRHIPVPEFDIRDMDPEYMKILRLASWKGHKVIFLTSNPENIAKKWEERIRNMFPQLEFEVRSVPTMEEKLRFANKLAEVVGDENVYFFDDSLPLVPRMGDRFSVTKMRMDKAALLHEHDKIARVQDEIMQDYFQNVKHFYEKDLKRFTEPSPTFKDVKKPFRKPGWRERVRRFFSKKAR